MNNKTNIRFSRTSGIAENRELAILTLDQRGFMSGEPAVIRFYSNPGKTEIDTYLAIGTKNGEGRDSYKIISPDYYDVVEGVGDYLPDVSELVHGETFIWRDQDNDTWNTVTIDPGKQFRTITPIGSTSKMYYSLRNSTIWVSGEDRKVRPINSFYSQSEIDTKFREVRSILDSIISDNFSVISEPIVLDKDGISNFLKPDE